MNVLIVENEAYLAQSITNKLNSAGYKCHIVSTINEAMQKEKMEVILLSSNAGGSLCEMFIRQNPQAIIIMMIDYVSEDTVTKPIKNGAKDYIIKPFMIDELLRKIDHHKNYQILCNQLIFYEEYFSFLENEMIIPTDPCSHMPFIIRSDSQHHADVFAIKFAKEKKAILHFASLKFYQWKEILPKIEKGHILYITHSEELKRNDFKEFLSKVKDKNVIVSLIANDSVHFPNVITIQSKNPMSSIDGNILPLKEYEKCIIQKYENRYSDVELADKLGISRKNLWEKRKKYGIERKK
ncbi:hypothetical protein BBW65_07350 [Helicobacter enhydrae]|uniref:Response regulatory domain-containing protein n=1 Tax=Helicobacter enhydrae TaxID=222136 RepID=A0A1B1U771_9HELI|nr:response regulator [Helicobacter enhydrae]ANV98623.1 hypothetical protein BBW65_07350 [Helicobacter enhydrae]